MSLPVALTGANTSEPDTLESNFDSYNFGQEKPMSLSSVLAGLGLLALVVLLIVSGVLAINAWEDGRDR